MSKKDRTIAFYSIFLEDKKTEDMYEEESVSKVIRAVISYINSINNMNDRKIEKKADNKVYYLENINYDNEKDDILYLTFISAKYNHVPDLINTETLEEKNSNKTNIDGDKEYTHVGLLLKENEIIMVHEQRTNGTPKSIIGDYLKKFFNEYNRINGIRVEYRLAIEIIPDKNFVEELLNLKRINLATIVIAKEEINMKPFQRFAGRNEVQQNVQITFKSEAKKTISNNDVLNAYNNRDSEKVKRMIIHGFNENGRVRLDTEPIKTISKVSVELNSNGIVNNESIEGEYKKLFEGMM